LVPPSVTLVTVNATAPELVSVTGVGLLLLPTACDGKVIEAGEKLVPAPGTVELSSTNTVDRGLSMIKSGLPSPFMSVAWKTGASV
jgi:hypothetical protein